MPHRKNKREGVVTVLNPVYICTPNHGNVAEWLGRALQKLVQRFESARYLTRRKPAYIKQAFLFLAYNHLCPSIA